MDKKKINIVLILIVTLVWGKNIYSYTRLFFSKKEEKKEKLNIKLNYEMPSVQDFKIINIDRDPFLDISLNKKKNKVESSYSDRKKTRKVTSNIEDVWPSIKYYGFIKGTKSKKKAILKVNDEIMNVTEGEKFYKNFSVKNVLKDSVIIKQNKINKVFKKL